MRMWRAMLLSVATAVCSAGLLRAQQAAGGRCNIELRPANDSLRMTSTTSTPNGPRNVFVGGRVEARCLNQDVRLLADSAEYYQGAQVLYLIGHVRYTEPRVRVTSDQMNYFQVDERLIATGNVEATLPSGSIMRGPQATYYRAVKGMRPAAKLEAVQRPRLWLSQRDSTGTQSEPVQITANQITTDNDSLVYAGGKVEITRSDLDARSDSAFLDSGNEFARLMIQPVIIGKGEKSYTLRGRQVELYTRNRIVQRVLAQAEARATSEDLLLTADTIDLRVDHNKAQAAYIWGKSRARAVSPDRDLVADSLAVRMPDQQLREVRAFRQAIATTMPDTATVRSGEKDWLKGDTIFAFFDTTARRRAGRIAPASPVAPRSAVVTAKPKGRGKPTSDSAATGVAATARDSARRVVTAADSTQSDTTTIKPQLRELRSIGHASARYQVAAQGSPPERPAINYSRGDRITVTMDSVGVSQVQIDEHAVGVYLDPVRDSSAIPGANAKVPLESTPGAATPVSPTPTAPTPKASTPAAPASTAPRLPTKPAATVPRSTPARP
jgi:lipopolysaccharide export system protein LptA